jgi:hypothetical protein
VQAVWIVKTFDVFEHGKLGFGLGFKTTPSQEFAFEASEEAL